MIVKHLLPVTLSIVISVVFTTVANAQIGIGIDSNRHRYIAYEPIKITLTIRNDSGHVLVFDRDDLLSFSVIDGLGDAVSRFQNVGTILDGLTLQSGATRSITFPLNTYYAMQNDSDYEVYAQIEHDRLRTDFRSNRLVIEVRKGATVWEREFGVPSLDADGEIRTRQAKILRFQEKETDVYCLRIEDRDSVYSVTRLAHRIIGADPEGEVDALGNIHVLLRVKARLFLYHIYTYDGELKQEKMFVIEEIRPTLHRDTELGRVTVVGGRPAIRGVDYVHPGEKSLAPQVETPVLEPL